jgi:hypothetical protein
MSWARPGSAGGALGRPWGPWGGGGPGGGRVMQSVCSRKPPYKIHEDLRDSSGKGSEKKNDKNYPLQCSNRRPACGTLSGIDPRPFLEISAQDQLRSKGIKKNSRMAAVSMRSAGGRVQVPPLRPNRSLWFRTALTILGWYAKEERL